MAVVKSRRTLEVAPTDHYGWDVYDDDGEQIHYTVGIRTDDLGNGAERWHTKVEGCTDDECTVVSAPGVKIFQVGNNTYPLGGGQLHTCYRTSANRHYRWCRKTG